jgi:hypothetical protein
VAPLRPSCGPTPPPLRVAVSRSAQWFEAEALCAENPPDAVSVQNISKKNLSAANCFLANSSYT